MIATAIIAGVSAAASISGGIIKAKRARQAAKRQQAAIDKMNADNEAWYMRKYNEDYTQRSEFQNALQQARDTLIKRNNAAAGLQAVMGGTDASVAATKEAANEAFANTVSNAAAGASAEKDRAENTYLNRKDNITSKQMALDQQRDEQTQANIDSAMTAVAKTGEAASAVVGSIPSTNTQVPTGKIEAPDTVKLTSVTGVDASGNPVNNGGDFMNENLNRLNRSTRIGSILMR